MTLLEITRRIADFFKATEEGGVAILPVKDPKVKVEAGMKAEAEVNREPSSYPKGPFLLEKGRSLLAQDPQGVVQEPEGKTHQNTPQDRPQGAHHWVKAKAVVQHHYGLSPLDWACALGESFLPGNFHREEMSEGKRGRAGQESTGKGEAEKVRGEVYSKSKEMEERRGEADSERKKRGTGKIIRRENGEGHEIHLKDFAWLFSHPAYARAPLSRIVGQGWFCGRAYELNSATLDPRWESEGLVDLVQEKYSSPMEMEMEMHGGQGGQSQEHRDGDSSVDLSQNSPISQISPLSQNLEPWQVTVPEEGREGLEEGRERLLEEGRERLLLLLSKAMEGRDTVDGDVGTKVLEGLKEKGYGEREAKGGKKEGNFKKIPGKGGEFPPHGHHERNGEFMRILDVGTGSGCLLIELLLRYPMARGWGVDLSTKALEAAKKNGRRHAVSTRATFMQGDGLAHFMGSRGKRRGSLESQPMDTRGNRGNDGKEITSRPMESRSKDGKEREEAACAPMEWALPLDSERVDALFPGNLQDLLFDIIVSNPPYIAQDFPLPQEVRDWDPPLALYGGRDGLVLYRAWMGPMMAKLAPGGICVLEMGWDQGVALWNLFQEISSDQGFILQGGVEKDEEGKDRYLWFRKS